MRFNIEEFRDFFPQLKRKKGVGQMIYFDNAASTLKLDQMIDRVNHFNRFETSNVHRGNHEVSRQGTENYEQARRQIQNFINAKRPEEIVFTRGTTESINLLADSLSSQFKENDEILISSMEHHSNIVPWQVLCKKKSCQLKIIDFDFKEGFSKKAFEKSFSKKTKLVSVLLYSNSFGNRLPVEDLTTYCREREVLTLLDFSTGPPMPKVGCSEVGL